MIITAYNVRQGGCTSMRIKVKPGCAPEWKKETLWCVWGQRWIKSRKRWSSNTLLHTFDQYNVEREG